MLPLFLTVFIDLLGFGIAIPLLPFYAQRFGAGADTITLLMATYSLAQFVALPYWGRVSDRIGRRPVLLLTLSASVVCWVAIAFADSLILLFLARGLAGAFAGNAGVAQAYVADTTTPENRARGHGMMGAAFGLGFLLGPAIGGLLAGAGGEHVDYITPFLCAAGLSAVALIFAATRLPESLSPAARAAARAQPRQSRLAQLVDAVTGRGLGVLVALMFLTPFVFSNVETTFALWSQSALGWGPRENGWAYSFMGLIAVLVQGGSIGPLTKAFGERGLLVIGPVLIGAGMLFLPLVGGVAALAVSLFLIVAGVCVTTPSVNSLVSQSAAEHERGSLLGIAQAAAGLARIAGPSYGGAVFENYGRNWPYFTGAALMVAAFALALRVRAPVLDDQAPRG
jgi:DHA1 family tetracycline resistance protein-like MFS transporter